MKGLAYLASRIAAFTVIYRRILPIGFAFVILIIGFVTRLVQDGASVAFEYLALSLLAAELTIKQNIDALLAGTTTHFLALIEIIGALIVLFGVIRLLSTVMVHVTGSQARWGAYLMSIVIVGIIEFTAIYAFTDVTGFVPIRDGLIYLLVNIGLFIPSWLNTTSLPTGGLDNATINTSANITQ